MTRYIAIGTLMNFIYHYRNEHRGTASDAEYFCKRKHFPSITWRSNPSCRHGGHPTGLNRENSLGPRDEWNVGTETEPCGDKWCVLYCTTTLRLQWRCRWCSIPIWSCTSYRVEIAPPTRFLFSCEWVTYIWMVLKTFRHSLGQMYGSILFVAFLAFSGNPGFILDPSLVL